MMSRCSEPHAASIPNFSAQIFANFPVRAKVDKIIAKENFYRQINSITKKLFQDQIARIVWEYKLAPSTINLAARNWPEIAVFRIELKSFEISPKVITAIESQIPYPILFLLVKDFSAKAVISYKTIGVNQKVKIDTYFETNWNDAKLANIKIDGVDVDAVYENFIRQIAGEKLSNLNYDANVRTNATTNVAENISAMTNDMSSSTLTNLEADLACTKEREQIQKQIAILERRIKSEPSIGQKQRLAEEKYKLLQELK